MTGNSETNEELINAIRAGGDRRALLCELYERNRGLISLWARRYQGRAEYDDLMQEAFLALNTAADAYKEETGYYFTSYFEKVCKRHFWRFCQASAGIRYPDYLAEDIRRYRFTAGQYETMHGRPPEIREAAELLSWTEGKTRQVKTYADRVTVSIDAPVTEDGLKLSDAIEDPRDDISDLLDAETAGALSGLIWAIVDELPPDQAETIRGRYRDGRTLAAIGSETGKTGGQVYRTQEKALKALKRSDRKKRLSELLNEDADPAGLIKYSDTGLTIYRQTLETCVERAAIKSAGRRGHFGDKKSARNKKTARN